MIENKNKTNGESEEDEAFELRSFEEPSGEVDEKEAQESQAEELLETKFETGMPEAAQVSRRRRLHDGDGKKGPMWLVTFTDAMALMLTFFVLLFSMQQPKEEYWQDFTTALYDGFNTYKGARLNQGRVQDVSLDSIDLNRALDLSYLKAIMQQVLSQNQSLDKVVLTDTSEGLLLSMPENLLFSAGNAKLVKEGESIISAIAPVFNRIRNQLIVRGHTDPRPITKKEIYQSNWDLSLDRAMQVSQILRTYGYQRSIVIQGVASYHADLLPKDLSRGFKESISRRVDILILDNDGTIIDEIL